MSNLKDFTGKNREFTGEEGIIPSNANTSTTGNRVDTKGRFRFNSTTNLMEYYTGSEWKSVDSPPIVSSLNVDGAGDATSTFIDSTLSGNSTIVIKGSLFDTVGASVTFVANTGSNISPLTTTINSASQITVTVAYSSFVNANEPYQIKVTNPSGLSATSLSLSVDRTQTFINLPDTTFGVFDITRSAVNIPAADFCGATDPDGDSLTYSVSVGALPSGLTIDASTGDITGALDAVGTNTTSTFSISAATADRTITRQFKITRFAPVTTTYQTTGGSGATASTFSIPSGLTKVNVLVVAGGAGGNGSHSGGGGGGGVIFRPEFPISGNTLPISVGDGSDGHRGANNVPASLFKGQDSNFGTLVAKGGGPSHNDSTSTNWPGNNKPSTPGPTNAPGLPGGSGGGGGSQNGPPSQSTGGTGDQPSEPGDSGTYGFGNNGGSGWGPPPTPAHTGGGGGGAGAAGGSSSPGGSTGGPGGAGREFNISGSPVYYGAGGGGGSHSGTGAPGGTGGGGNGNPQPHTSAPNQPNSTGNAGADHVGAGGGGGSTPPSSVPSPKYRGGTGVVIVSY